VPKRNRKDEAGPHDLRWLDIAPIAGGSEFSDEQVPLLDEPPLVTEARRLSGGPYLLAPDSAEQMPTDFLAVDGDAGVKEVIELAQSKLESASTSTVSDKLRIYLESGGEASKLLLNTLGRGLEAATPELEAASRERLAKAGLG
jgi:hypothetical protein